MEHKTGQIIAPEVRRHTFGVRLSVIMLGCVVLAGCAKATVPTVAAEPESFADIVASAIQEAETGGASDAQLAILREAQSKGEVSLEDARAAARAGVECVNDAGSFVIYDEYASGSGLVVPGFGYAGETPEHQAIGDECEKQEFSWVSGVYQTQPSSVEMEDRYRAQLAPIFRSCLERNGYATDPNASPDELLAQAMRVYGETNSAVDCIAEAGFR